MSIGSVLITYLNTAMLMPIVWLEDWFGVISRLQVRAGRDAVYLHDGIPILIDAVVVGKVWDRKFPNSKPFEFTNTDGTFSFAFEMRDIGRGIKTCILPIRNRAELVLMRMVFDVVTEFDGHGWRTYKVYLRCAGHYSRAGE